MDSKLKTMDTLLVKIQLADSRSNIYKIQCKTLGTDEQQPGYRNNLNATSTN